MKKLLFFFFESHCCSPVKISLNTCADSPWLPDLPAGYSLLISMLKYKISILLQQSPSLQVTVVTGARDATFCITWLIKMLLWGFIGPSWTRGSFRLSALVHVILNCIKDFDLTYDVLPLHIKDIHKTIEKCKSGSHSQLSVHVVEEKPTSVRDKHYTSIQQILLIGKTYKIFCQVGLLQLRTF